MEKPTHLPHKTHKKQAAKHVKLRHHHARPYRKRHVGLLVVCLIGFFIAIALLVQYRDQVMVGVTGSRNFVADLFGSKTAGRTTIESSYGFSFVFDQKTLYATAVDGVTGKVYHDSLVTQKKAYTSVQLTPYSIPQISDQTAFSMNYHPELQALSDGDLSKQAMKDAAIKSENVQLIKSQMATIGGQTFKQAIWQSKAIAGSVNNLHASFSVYTANISGHPVTITINEGFVDKPGTHRQYDDILRSIRFNKPVARTASATVTLAADHSLVPSLLDTVLQSQVVAAASAQDTTGASERIAALYGPAVAKIYNVYCTDIEFDGALLYGNVCGGGSGSGFFVSKDGYMATNGHVSSMDVRDLAITTAYDQVVLGGDERGINYLSAQAGIKESDIANAKTQEEAQAIIIDKLYDISMSHFNKANGIQNQFVELSDKQPDLDKLVSDTKDRMKYDLDSSMAAATTVATDYRTIDGIDGFRNSDVAIIKVTGKNFPVVKLGGIDDVTQGDNISILGFPGQASDNGLVDSKTTTATLTTGKVSSKKKASGSDKWLIETDTTIGHGNSGGPVFEDGGNVVGIATYTIDGSGSGSGVYNYIRDIQDLKSLASLKSITFDTTSETQSQWEQGMEYFYTAHYSKALPYFAKVKELYPNHNKVAEFVTTAQKRIAAGQDVQDFPIVPVAIAAGVLLLGVVGMTVVIIRHKKKHSVYKTGVAQGSVAPMAAGMSPQVVAVAPGVIQPATTQPAAQPSDPTPLTNAQPYAPTPSVPVQPQQPATNDNGTPQPPLPPQ